MGIPLGKIRPARPIPPAQCTSLGFSQESEACQRQKSKDDGFFGGAGWFGGFLNKWVFPKIGVSPKWMVYDGKSYQNG